MRRRKRLVGCGREEERREEERREEEKKEEERRGEEKEERKGERKKRGRRQGGGERGGGKMEAIIIGLIKVLYVICGIATYKHYRWDGVQEQEDLPVAGPTRTYTPSTSAITGSLYKFFHGIFNRSFPIGDYVMSCEVMWHVKFYLNKWDVMWGHVRFWVDQWREQGSHNRTHT